jgi:hypothetical protein
MADWDDWNDLLGGGSEPTISIGLSAKDKNGNESSMVIRRRDKKNGRAIFELFLNRQSTFGKNAGAPTGARIESLEVEGFTKEGCKGKKTCAQFQNVPAKTKLIKPSAASKFTFEPDDHDGGMLSGLLAKCSCHKDEESYKIYVTVSVDPAPPTTLRFSCCDACAADDEVDV